MKKHLLLAGTLIFSGILYAEKIVWNKDNNFNGWNNSYLAKRKIENGLLTLTEIKFDCRLLNMKVDIDPGKYNTFTFTYRATGGLKKSGEFYFSHAGENFSDARRWVIPPLVADGQWHTVSISPKNQKSWQTGGNIKSLRFDPTNSAGGKIEIREIILHHQDAVKKKLKTDGKTDGPEWPAVKSELWQKKDSLKNQPYFMGKMIRSPEDQLKDKKHYEFYLRRDFHLKSKPVFAFLQFTADDCAETFINGKSAGTANDWKICQVLDVTDLICVGKNTLAFHYINENSYGGVLAELYLQYADNSSQRIVTDKLFKSSSLFQKNWNSIDFDTKNWQSAVEQAPPPARPWRITLPYRYFQNLQLVTSAAILPAQVPAGKKIWLSITALGKVPEKDFCATITLKKSDGLVWKEKITIKKEYYVQLSPKNFSLKIPYETPLYLKPGKFTVSIETDMLSVHGEQWKNFSIETTAVKTDPKYPVKNICRVVNKNGKPQLELNGKPFFASWLGVPRHFVPEKLPVNVVTLGVSFEQYWPKIDSLNTDVFDIRAEKLRKLFPDAYFIINIPLNVPHSWFRYYPEETAKKENGEYVTYASHPNSYSSATALKQFEQNIEKTVKYLENTPYANRIIGYRISGGYTGEWLGWEGGNSITDFSNAAKQAYKRFFKTYYPQFKNDSIPGRMERQNNDNSVLWDQTKYHRAVAWQRFASRQINDFLIPLCKKLKAAAGKDKITGTYYGYTSTLHHTGISQYRAHYDLKRLLDSESVDFLMSPNSYVLRNLGEFCGEMKPFSSLQNNSVIPVCEDDTRTHNSFDVQKTPGSATQTITLKQSIAVERRNMGIAICRQSPNYYYPLVGGGEVSFPAMKKEIAIQKTVGQHCLDVNAKRNAQIALVVSEETIKTMPSMGGQAVSSGIIDQNYRADGTVRKTLRNRCVINFETFVGNQDRFTRSGAPVDQLLAEDLADHPGNYKLYVFLNCYKYDDKFLGAVKKLQQKNCVLLWLYAPGFWKGLSGNTANMKNLTGMDFEMLSNTSAAVKLKDGRIMGTPAAQINPLFAVKNKNVQILGTYSNGKTGLAAVKTQKALTVFSGAWQLDTLFIREMLDKAGVFRYIDSDDPFEANTKLLVLHARRAGKKTIRLPRKTNVLDIFAAKIIARNTDKFESSFNLHETKQFYCGDDAGILLEKIQSVLKKY